MPEPTEPAKPAKPAKAGGPTGASEPAQDPATPPAPPTEPLPAQSEPPTAPLPAAAAGPTAAQAAVPTVTAAAPAGPPSGPPAGPPSGPPAGGPPLGGPPFGGPPAAGPPPKGPGLWRQATSTTGGTIAVIVAGCLAALMVLGVVATIGVVAVRHGHDRIERVDQARDRGDLPPGAQRKLDRLPQGPNLPRGQGPGQGNGQRNGQPNGQGGMGNGAGGGIGPLMRGAMGLGNVQHGEFTVQDNGKATVMTLQRGEVTKASATAVTVKSADDFTANYAVGADTKGKATDLKVGDAVVVVAEKDGAKAVLVMATRRS